MNTIESYTQAIERQARNTMIHSNGYLNPHIAEAVRCIVRKAMIFQRLYREAIANQWLAVAPGWREYQRITLDSAKAVAKLR